MMNKGRQITPFHIVAMPSTFGVWLPYYAIWTDHYDPNIPSNAYNWLWKWIKKIDAECYDNSHLTCMCAWMSDSFCIMLMLLQHVAVNVNVNVWTKLHKRIVQRHSDDENNEQIYLITGKRRNRHIHLLETSYTLRLHANPNIHTMHSAYITLEMIKFSGYKTVEYIQLCQFLWLNQHRFQLDFITNLEQSSFNPQQTNGYQPPVFQKYLNHRNESNTWFHLRRKSIKIWYTEYRLMYDQWSTHTVTNEDPLMRSSAAYRGERISCWNVICRSPVHVCIVYNTRRTREFFFINAFD